MKGKNFLKVTGILMIIFGAIALIVSIVAFAGVALLVSLAESAGTDISSGTLYLACVVLLVSSIAEFVAGILGVVNCSKPEKAGTCLVCGIIVAVLAVLGELLTIIGGGKFSVFNLFAGLVIPALYIAGAFLNKKDAAQATTQE